MPKKVKKDTASGSQPERGERGSASEIVPPNEKAIVDAWGKRIKARLKCKDFEDFHKSIPKWRLYAGGRQYTDEADVEKQKLVRANLIYATMINALPQIYAKNPEIDVAPTESVDPIRYEAIKKFCSTLGIVLNNQFAPSQANLKSKAKMNVMAAQTTAWGVLKAIYQKDIEKDPIIQNRINDVQDNIKHIETLIKAIDDPLEVEEQKAQQEELKQQLISLEAKVEVVRAEGLLIDRVLSENLVMAGNVKETGAYLDAEWQAERIYNSKDWSKDMFGFAPEKATSYTKASGSYTEAKNTSDKEEEELCFWEIWHKKTNTVYTICEGYSGYMREPYSPEKLGERWYPYFILILNPLDGKVIPLCDVELLIELQDEYNETRTNLKDHRRWSIPHWIGLKGSVKPADAKAIRDAEPFEVVLIEGEPGRALRDYLEVFQNPPIVPQVYDTQPIRVDWELVSGQPDSARGVVAKAKTLGEAEYLQQGMATRMSERMDSNEDMMQQMAQYCAEILLQELTEQQVLRIAGPGAVWPQMTKEETFDMVQIKIRAGSSGRPDKRMEQEVWMKFLPLLADTITRVHEFRKAGDTTTADSLVKLMQETMRRFDERMDVKTFFPDKEEGDVDPQQLALMQQQQQMAGKQLELLSAQIMKLKTEGLKNIAQAEAAELGTQIDGYLRIIEIMQQGLMNPASQSPDQTKPTLQ